MEAAEGEEFVVVEMAVGFPLVLIEGNVFEEFAAVVAGEAVWVETLADGLDHAAGNVLLTAAADCACDR